jgi:predicted transcriptional regulator
MNKKMIYIDKVMDATLQRVAHAQHKSVAQVIREAIEEFFKKKEIYDLVEYDRRMAEYLGKPAAAVPFREIMDK